MTCQILLSEKNINLLSAEFACSVLRNKINSFSFQPQITIFTLTTGMP